MSRRIDQLLMAANERPRYIAPIITYFDLESCVTPDGKNIVVLSHLVVHGKAHQYLAFS
jgi:hypothetical protein